MEQDLRKLSFGEFCAYCKENMPEEFNIEIQMKEGVSVFEDHPDHHSPIVHEIPQSGNLHQDITAAWSLIQKIVNDE